MRHACATGTFWPHQAQDTVGFELHVARKPIESLPSYPLRDCVAMWELRDRDGKLVQHGQQALPDLEQPQTILADWSSQQDFVKDTLTVKILDPQGEIAGRMSMDAIQGVFGGEPVPEYK